MLHFRGESSAAQRYSVADVIYLPAAAAAVGINVRISRNRQEVYVNPIVRLSLTLQNLFELLVVGESVTCGGDVFREPGPDAIG